MILRKLTLLTIAYVIGILLGNSFGIESFWIFCCVITILAIILSFTILKNKNCIKSDYILVWTIVAVFVFGGLYINIKGDVLNKNIGKFANEYIKVTGYIDDIPKLMGDTQNAVSYKLLIDNILYKDEIYPIHETIEVVGFFSNTHDNKSIFEYGNSISLEGFLEIPEKPVSTNQRDYNLAKKANGVFFQMSSKHENIKPSNLPDKKFSISHVPKKVFSYFSKLIDENFSPESAGLLKAVLIGDKSTLSKNLYENMVTSGIVHVAVVSGLHVSMLLAIVSAILLSLRFNRIVVNFFSIFFLIFYVIATGANPSVIRAAITVIFYILAQMFNRQEDKLNALCVALLIITGINPFAIFDIGLQLSFLSILGIYYLSPVLSYYFRGIKNKYFRDLLSFQISVQLATLMTVAFHFNQIPLLSVITNGLVLFVLPLYLSCGILFFVFSSATGIVWIFQNVLEVISKYIIFIAEQISKIPIATIYVASPKYYYFVIYALGLFVWLYFYYNKERVNNIIKKVKLPPKAVMLVVIAGILTISTSFALISSTNNMVVTFVNVEQGDGTVVKLPGGEVMIIDGGGISPPSNSNNGEKLFIPYLRKEGINKVDVAVVSHYDSDHACGVISIIEQMKVENIILPSGNRIEGDDQYEIQQKLITLAKEKNINILYLYEGDVINFKNDVFLTMLGPPKEIIDDIYGDENSKSQVLKLTYGQMDFLFTGDMGSEVEESLVQNHENGDVNLSAEVLKVAHHGSKTSSTDRFVNLVEPDYGVISLSKSNSYGHPHQNTLDILEKYGINIYRTDQSGNITFTTLPDRFKAIKVDTKTN